MMRKFLRYLLLVWIILNAILLILSFSNLRNSGETVEFILWAYPLGSFVWADLVVWSIYNIVACTIILLIKDNRYILIFPLLFWLIRGLGEMNYWFLQQFNQPVPHPHNDYDWHKNMIYSKVFGNISDQEYFFLYQQMWQAVMILCIFALIYVFKKWKRLDKIVNQ